MEQLQRGTCKKCIKSAIGKGKGGGREVGRESCTLGMGNLVARARGRVYNGVLRGGRGMMLYPCVV